ncbi:MAG: hypothetical protein P4L74_06740 [Candidatus Doudnabacteria bacterium]|nr:hypothetical protein [Candidatus Doudnabacteria bacterium]
MLTILNWLESKAPRQLQTQVQPSTSRPPAGRIGESIGTSV